MDQIDLIINKMSIDLENTLLQQLREIVVHYIILQLPYMKYNFDTDFSLLNNSDHYRYSNIYFDISDKGILNTFTKESKFNILTLMEENILPRIMKSTTNRFIVDVRKTNLIEIDSGREFLAIVIDVIILLDDFV